MSLAYPIAKDVTEALSTPKGFERAAQQAMQTSGEKVVLETEWLRLKSDELAGYEAAIQNGQTHGYLQLYSGEADVTILAVTFWRETGEPADPKPASAIKRKRKAAPASEAQDHADDLYFRHRPKRRRKKYVDPNQLDLFVVPDQRGFDRRDPNNANIVIAEDEGDGTSFGIAPKDVEAKDP